MTRAKKVFTFSNITAFIALFIALGGSVYAAGKINGAQIKPGSVPGNRIKPKSLSGKRIKPNSLGTKQINEKTLKGVVASAVGALQYSTVTVPLSGYIPGGYQGTAVCPAGTYVIGGGAAVSNESFAYVNDSAPSPTHTGWIATAYGQDGMTMTVSAICTAAHAIGTEAAQAARQNGPRYGL